MPTSKDDAGVDDVCVPGIGLVSIPGTKKKKKCVYTKAYSFYTLSSRALRVLRGPC